MLHGLLGGLLGALLGGAAVGVIRYLSPARRRQRERLGGRREASRFQHAWAKGKVPSGIDRDAWQRELELWPPTDLRERQRRVMRAMMLLGVVAAVALVAVATITSDGDVGVVVGVVAPLLVMGLVVAVAMRFIPDEQEAATRRTARLRAALEPGPAEGPDRPQPTH
jgi:hypothetical protein